MNQKQINKFIDKAKHTFSDCRTCVVSVNDIVQVQISFLKQRQFRINFNVCDNINGNGFRIIADTYPVTKYGGYKQSYKEGGELTNYTECSKFLFIIRNRLNRVKTYRTFERHPKVKRTCPKPFEFVEQRAKAIFMSYEYQHDHLIVEASITMVAFDKNTGRIYPDKQELSNPERSAWYKINFVGYVQYSVNNGWTGGRPGTLLFNGDDKFYPISGNGYYVDKKFNSPYLKPNMLTTKDRDILLELAKSFTEKVKQ